VREVGDLVLNEARRLGDRTLSPKELAEMFKPSSSGPNRELIEQVVYGSTPLAAAAHETRERFERAERDMYDQRALLVISDGEPTDGDPRGDMEKIRDSGVTVIACFVTDDDVTEPKKLVGLPQGSWTNGTRLMWDITSEIDEASPFARYLLAQGWSVEPRARLFVQINHSEILRKFIVAIGESSKIRPER
jgi:hypothetical protein